MIAITVAHIIAIFLMCVGIGTDIDSVAWVGIVLEVLVGVAAAVVIRDELR